MRTYKYLYTPIYVCDANVQNNKTLLFLIINNLKGPVGSKGMGGLFIDKFSNLKGGVTSAAKISTCVYTYKYLYRWMCTSIINIYVIQESY